MGPGVVTKYRCVGAGITITVFVACLSLNTVPKLHQILQNCLETCEEEEQDIIPPTLLFLSTALKRSLPENWRRKTCFRTSYVF